MMDFNFKTGPEIEAMSDAEVREYIKQIAEKVNSITQEEGESDSDFLARTAELLGWGDGCLFH